MSLSIDVSPGRFSTTRVLRAAGPITLQNFTQLQAEFLREQSPLTVLDLSDVPQMDSAGLGVILKFYVAAQKRGHKLVLIGTRGRVLDLLKLTRVDSLIPLADSIEQAEMI